MIAGLSLLVGAFCWIAAFICYSCGYYDQAALNIAMSIANLWLFAWRFVKLKGKIHL